MNNPKTFTINSQKFDGKISRSWEAELLEETSELFTFVGIFNKEIKHSKLGVIRPGTVSYEYYWKNNWYNIFRFHEPEGDLRNFYCNINKPPVRNQQVLNYIDLDIDVIVWKDFSFEVVDIDEFDLNAVKFNYPADLRKSVKKSLEEVLRLIKTKSFPFDSVE